MTGAAGRVGRPVNLSTYLVTDPVLSALSGLNVEPAESDTVTSGRATGRQVLAVIAAAVAGGVTAVQIRDKTATTTDLFDLVVAASRLTSGHCLLFVDDRVDVFLAARNAGAHVDGIHIGQSDLPADRARELIGPDALLGLTANTVEHLRMAHALPAGTVDYFGVGVIRPTTTKANHPEPLGVAGFADVAGSTRMPCVAIGGIRLDDTGPLRAAGAAGLAVVSAICAAPSPQAATRAFVEHWAGAAFVPAAVARGTR